MPDTSDRPVAPASATEAAAATPPLDVLAATPATPAEVAAMADRLVAEFGDRADISARSVLVTVFGDTIAPAGGDVWLSELFDLVAPFGFSERLVRTSLSRLVASGWFESERQGRRSRYRLTEWGAGETAAAEQRIYHRPVVPWDGEWSLVSVGGVGGVGVGGVEGVGVGGVGVGVGGVDGVDGVGGVDAVGGVGGAGGSGVDVARTADVGDLTDSLRWSGFARLADGVWGLPHDADGRHERIIARLGLASRLPVAVARFVDIAQLVDGGRLTAAFGLDDLVAGYDAFVDRYRSLVRPSHDAHVELEPDVAFAVRTMVVHELRRLRLRDPDLPERLLPQPWSGAQAFALASAIYRDVEPAAATWIASVGLDGYRPQPTRWS